MRASILLAAALLAAAPAYAQHQHQENVAAAPRVGSVSLANDGNAAAQPNFQRGLALLHNFEYLAAIQAFQEAQKADPGFVLAYWGEAMAHNHPLWAEQYVDRGRAVLARLGPTPQARAARARSPRERQWLETVEALYGRGSKIERDRAYAESMRRLFESNPADVDARAFRALSLMGLSHGGRNIPLYMQAAALLEEALPAHPNHPGVLHYLIHAYDDPAHAPLGERAARRYALVAPDAGHAQHMVSHIYLALGRWPEVEQANRQAMAVVDAQRAARGQSPTLCGHYSHWLVYALDQQGKDSRAIVDGCRQEALADPASLKDSTVLGGVRNLISNWAHIAVQHGADTGRWPAELPAPARIPAMARFSLAYGQLLASRRDPAGAASALEQLRSARATIAAAMPREWPDDHETSAWLDRAIAQGEAVLALAQGRQDEGLALLAKAADAEAALPVPFGPPVLQKPSAELLGDELLALGRKAEAAAAYRRVLAAAPNRRVAVRGLEAATR